MLGWILVCITIGWVGELSGPDVWLGFIFSCIGELFGNLVRLVGGRDFLVWRFCLTGLGWARELVGLC